MPVTYPNFNPSTGVIDIQGPWSSNRFKKMVADLGITRITNIIVHDGATLHLENQTIGNIVVHRYGFFSASNCVLSGISNNGIMRTRNVTLRDVNNDGQIYLSSLSRCDGIHNERLINVSRSFVTDMTNTDTSCVKATSSYFVNSSAKSNTSLYMGSSLILGCTDALQAWSRPVFDDPSAKLYNDDFRLMFAAVELLCITDYVDSKGTPDPRQQVLIKAIDTLLKKGAQLPYDIAKEIASRIIVLSTGAKDRLVRMVGYRIIPYKTAGIFPTKPDTPPKAKPKAKSKSKAKKK